MHFETCEALAVLLAHHDESERKTGATVEPCLTRFAQLCQDIHNRVQGPKYILMARQINSLPLETRGRLNVPKDEIDASEYLSTILRNIKRGGYKGHVSAIISWLFKFYPQRAQNFFDSLDPEFTATIKADTSFLTKCDLFICWSGPLAQAVGKDIRAFFDVEGEASAFLSSTDLERGLWTEELRARATESSSGLVLVTQDALDSSYLLHDVALLAAQERPIQLLLLNVPRTALPAAFQQYQMNDFSVAALKRIIGGIYEKRKANFPEKAFADLAETLETTIAEHSKTAVTADENRWGANLSRPLLMANQATSPYGLEEIISVAQERIVLIAQNHWFMTQRNNGNDQKFFGLITDAIARNVTVEIVAMHKDARPYDHDPDAVPDAMRVWAMHLGEPRFIPHAEQCWEVLGEWMTQLSAAKKDPAGLGQLRIYRSYFTPLTLSFVDPEADRGFLVLSFRPPGAFSMGRPQLVIRRKHEPLVFNHFLQSVEHVLKSGEWEQVFCYPSRS